MADKDKPAAKLPGISRGASLKTQVEWRPEDRAHVVIAIGQAFDMQKQYGKTSEQLENIVAGFTWVLGVYPAERVMYGIGEYVRRNADMPTPSDIVKIIDPKPPAWKPDKPYYITLKKLFADEGPYGLTLDEIEYIAKYEEHMRVEMRQAQ